MLDIKRSFHYMNRVFAPSVFSLRVRVSHFSQSRKEMLKAQSTARILKRVRGGYGGDSRNATVILLGDSRDRLLADTDF